jgi:hypothetical protein
MGERCARRVDHRYRRDQPAFPARWFTAYFVFSPVASLFHRRLAKEARLIVRLDSTCSRQDLCASIRAPGPYDLTVRERFHLSLPTSLSRNLIEGSMKAGLTLFVSSRAWCRSRETRPATAGVHNASRPTHPAPRLVTTAIRPSCGPGWVG